MNSWSWIRKSCKRIERAEYLKEFTSFWSSNAEVEDYFSRWTCGQVDSSWAVKRIDEITRDGNKGKIDSCIKRSWVDEGKFESWDGKMIEKGKRNFNF